MILSLLLHALTSQASTFLPIAWLERQGFQRMSGSRETWKEVVDYRSLEKLLQFHLSIIYFNERSAKKFAHGQDLFGSDGVSLGITMYRIGLANGMPLGTNVRIRSEPSRHRFSMAFRTEWMYGYATFGGAPNWFEGTAPVLPVEDFAETLARQVLARAESRRLIQAGRKTLGTAEVSTVGTPEVELVDLGDWAKARGWTITTDDGMSTLTKGERKLRIPLGALAVEVDGKWKDLPEVVMLKDDRWWVPLDGLEAAVRE